MPDPSPVSRPSRIRRIVLLLVAVDIVILAAAVVVWFVLRDDQADGNVVNEGLRGSRPPAGQQLPDLASMAGVRPAVPAPAELHGDAVQLVATCLECPSGDIIGGYLGRLTREDVPDGARVLLVGWEGDLAAWSERWHVDSRLVELHAASSAAATEALRERFGIERRGDAAESGITFLYDPRGRWRATYFIGQLDREDITHDLGVLADD
jgi:hypothetical protein